jgi:3'-phosphoadenosine 5'-phosphosulfate sulfotransferase (PAPS reductase)/FAD synthetase
MFDLRRGDGLQLSSVPGGGEVWPAPSMQQVTSPLALRYSGKRGEMKHIVCFSGGKDSTALVLWAKENLPDFTAVFCDTGWEHPITYAYVEEINKTLLGGSLVILRSEKYPGGMPQLVQIKKRVPSAKARFCTEALKVRPMIDWMQTINDEITVYQGIRADESESRSRMLPRQWSDDFDAWIERPLLTWTAAQCFALMAERGIQPNPLYLLGASRVGCFPCVMVNQHELKSLMKRLPEIKEAIASLEAINDRSFFPPNYIPERFQTGHDPKSGKSFPKCEDVFRYIESVDEDQIPMFPARSCMSVYNLCE